VGKVYRQVAKSAKKRASRLGLCKFDE